MLYPQTSVPRACVWARHWLFFQFTVFSFAIRSNFVHSNILHWSYRSAQSWVEILKRCFANFLNDINNIPLHTDMCCVRIYTCWTCWGCGSFSFKCMHDYSNATTWHRFWPPNLHWLIVFAWKATAARLSGTTKKSYASSIKVLECLLDLQPRITIGDLAVQFGCTEAKTLAMQVLSKCV